MEASSLKIKKQIHKGKLKNTMKNVICQPEIFFWPIAYENETIILTEELNKLKVDIPDIKKPHWSELSQVPKELRQKPAPIPKVNGFIFGITECKKAIEIKQCAGILIDADVNPKNIVRPLLEICFQKGIAFLCLKELRTITNVNFGIATSVLGMKQGLLPDLEKSFLQIAQLHGLPMEVTEPPEDNDDMSDTSNENENEEVEREFIACPYLYRVLNSMRVFSPAIAARLRAKEEEQFIKVSNSEQNETTHSKQYMKMNVKKISGNPNRKKVSKGNPKE